MSTRLLIPVLLLCLLFNGNLFPVVMGYVKAQCLGTLDDQSSLTVEIDTDGEAEKNFGSFCCNFVAPTKIRAAIPLLVVCTHPDELIYTLHHLQI